VYSGVLVGGALADKWSARDERGRILVVIVALIFHGPAILMVASGVPFPAAVVGIITYGFTGAFTASNMMSVQLCAHLWS
jgi:hypothetical protein